MSSNLYSEAAKDEEDSNFNCESPRRKVSVKAQLPSKFYNERLAAPRIKDAIFVDEARVLRYRRPSGRPRSGCSAAETEVLYSALSSGIYQKPWPSRKGGAGVEELVKYMSSVPYYLQRMKKADNIQEEALNFGVIDWRTLEKWTSSQKADQKISISSYVNKLVLPSLPKNQLCSCSSQNSGDSLAQEKKTSSLDGDVVRPAEDKPRLMSDPPSSTTLSSSHESCHKFKHEYRTSMQTETGNSTEYEMSNHCEKQSSTHDGRSERNFMVNGHVLDTLQASSSTKSKPLSAAHGDRKAMGVHKSLSMKLPQKNSHQGSLSNMFQNDEFDMSVAAPPTKIGATSPEFMTKNEKGNHIGKSSGNFVASTDEKSQNQTVEDINGRKKQSLIKNPSTAGLKWLNRSSSLTDMSTVPQLKETDGLEIFDDKERSNSRGRRSPLRRILDPLFKLNNNSLSSGKESSSSNTMIRSSDSSTAASKLPIASHGLLHDVKNNGGQMEQALVKLAWKNSQPLIMFSTNEDNILVASMRMTRRLDSNDLGVVYTIVTAKESKKKGGILTGQRNKKSNLLYDVVGRVEVSSAKLSSFDSKNLEISRQFVLVVDELLPCEESPNPAHSSELAAIIVKAPYQKLKGSIYNSHIDSMQVEKYPEYARMCSIAVILPSGIHGFSDTGKPSTILERWKSGGSCDCGGWDEGCRLTVLADMIRQTKISGPVPECPSTNGFNHVELFTRGIKGENKHDFSMVAFKEGLYTVEFGSWVTSLQAFAICISTLHSISSIHNPARIKNSMKSTGSLPGYEPHHPPFSPVGRS